VGDVEELWLTYGARSVPKYALSTLERAVVQQQWPDGFSGWFTTRTDSQVGSGSVPDFC
jgi:hypothetical protein